MKSPIVLVLESGHLLGNLLRSTCPERTWVVRQVRSVEDVREELHPGRPVVLVAEIVERFLEAVAWVLIEQPGLPVIAVVAEGDARLEATLSDAGLLATISRRDVFSRLPELVGRAIDPLPLSHREVTA